MKLMGFVDDDEVDLRSFAPGKRLDATHLDRLITVGSLVDALHDTDALDALGFERRDGLVDQAEGGNHERDALALVERALNDVRGRQGLAETSRRLKHRAPMAGSQRSPKRFQCAFLMRAEGAKRPKRSRQPNGVDRTLLFAGI